MDVPIKTLAKSLFYVLCLIAMLAYPKAGLGQSAYSSFEPFKFKLEEEYSSNKEAFLLDQIVTIQEGIEKQDVWSMKYWNGAYPSYRWHQLLMETSRRHKGHKNGGRVAIMHLAIYDATVEAWQHKSDHFQKPPYQLDERITRLGQVPDFSTFICEWSVAAGAAHQVISYYFPEQVAFLDSNLTAFKRARLATGLQLYSDIEKGLEIGKKIANQYIEYAKGDRTHRKWEGGVPEADSLWSGDPSPWDPTKRQWKPLALASADQFRPEPPPTDWSADMEELRQFYASNKTSEIAWKWKSEPVWDRLVERKVMEYDLDPLEAAFANAVFHTARFDGIIAAWDGKYHYWGIRPFQYDPSFQPILVETPNFPGYPAGHTTVAGSIARVLSFLFPEDESMFYALAKECSESRFEGGVHFRTDNEVGLEVGYQVGQQVIDVFVE